jgi:hypothetical protein
VSAARKLLILGGVSLATFGMLYGLHYALLVEHQTLARMGGQLSAAFVSAAQGQSTDAHAAVQGYASTKYDYVRQVDVHSHWIGLAMIMIVLGVVFDRTGLSDRMSLMIAAAMMAGSIVFPLGVLLQSAYHGAEFASVLAIAGSVLVIASLGVAAVGFIRQSG